MDIKSNFLAESCQLSTASPGLSPQMLATTTMVTASSPSNFPSLRLLFLNWRISSSHISSEEIDSRLGYIELLNRAQDFRSTREKGIEVAQIVLLSSSCFSQMVNYCYNEKSDQFLMWT